MSQQKSEKVFGEVSDYQGVWKKEDNKPPATFKHEQPHWHDSCFDGSELKEGVVEESQLSSHF